MVRAAIYARISSDDGTALGVGRQVEDCRKLAAEQGWEVVEEYVDNDVSASTGKRRPGYEAMLADVNEGRIDAVLAYHVDRLTRRPIELEGFVDALTAAGVSRVRFAAGGEMDPGNGDNLLVMRIQGAVAASETATKSRRVRRKLDQVAAEGRPHGGTRPFGFETDKITHRPDEAALIVAMVDRYLAGESLRSLAQWLNDEGVPTVRGGMWVSSTVRGILSSARIAGLREHRGSVAGPGVWDPIISEAKRDKVLARIAGSARTGQRTPRRYLLSGMCRCHKCGGRLFAAARIEQRATGAIEVRRYVCASGPDHRGCGGTMIVAPPVEELVAQAVLHRLDTPELAAALTGQADDDSQAAALSAQLAEDREQLDDLATMWADKAISLREWSAARKTIEDRIADTERRLGRLTRTDALTGLIGKSGELQARWATLDLDRQVAIVRAIVDHVTIGPGTPGARAFDRNRVSISWRL
jgi:DNA invertase Pin-like site-specific DNA recombinase